MLVTPLQLQLWYLAVLAKGSLYNRISFSCIGVYSGVRMGQTTLCVGAPMWQNFWLPKGSVRLFSHHPLASESWISFSATMIVVVIILNICQFIIWQICYLFVFSLLACITHAHTIVLNLCGHSSSELNSKPYLEAKLNSNLDLKIQVLTSPFEMWGPDKNVLTSQKTPHLCRKMGILGR